MLTARVFLAMATVVALAMVTSQRLRAQSVCGHCHQDEHPIYPNEYVHQFTDDDPAFSDCSSIGGHPSHDCEDGDGSSWTPGPCHPPCPEELPEELGLILSEHESLSASIAIELSRRYPLRVSFDPATGVMSVRLCAGRTNLLRALR